MQSVYVIGKHPPDICPAGAAAEKIEFFVPRKIVDDGMLINGGRVTAGRFCRFYIGYTGKGSPYPAGGSISRGKTTIEEVVRVTQTDEVMAETTAEAEPVVATGAAEMR